MSALTHTVYLALGSNLGDRRARIEQAIAHLGGDDEVRIEARSPLYETDAVADQPQPPYLNAVIRARTALAPPDLLARALSVEAALGRVRPPGRAKAPRTIDVDVLLYDDLVIDDPPTLRVPHPALLERPFVRIPLADVAVPGLRHPITGDRLDRAEPSPSVRSAG
jgi:2-amino-4-hydroxy-6-hydroxymethyldihydropteridine diphosphokinase